MTATYGGNPKGNKRDAIRFLIGDNKTVANGTEVLNPRMTDQEIDYLIDQYTEPYSVAAFAAEQIASDYVGKPDKTVGPLSIKYGQLAKGYMELAASLRKRARVGSGGPILTSNNQSRPLFSIGMHDGPGSPEPPHVSYIHDEDWENRPV